MLRSLFLIILCLSLSGCFLVARHIQKNIITAPGYDKGVHFLEYEFHGVGGTHSFWLKDHNGFQYNLPLDLARFPGLLAKDQLNLSDYEYKELKKATIDAVRNYMGNAKQTNVTVMKAVDKHGKEKNFFLDIFLEDANYTLVEVMVSKGLYLVEKDLAKNSKKKKLLKIEAKAQRSRLGMWKNATAFNPNWHD